MTFPAAEDDVSKEWIEGALRSSGVQVPDGSLVGLSGKRIGTGLVGLNIRFTLEWAPGVEGAPLTVVAKLPSTDPTSRATGVALRNYEREVAFYRGVAPATPARFATCYAAEWDGDSGDFIVLLEDLAPGEVGDQMRGCTVFQAEIGVDVAAAFHGAWWGHERLAEFATWMSGPPTEESADQLVFLWNMALPQFAARHPGALTAEQDALLERFGSSLRTWTLGRTGPLTLTHGDFRVDNMIFGADWMVPVDWQTPGLGVGVGDIAYFLGASLLPDDRRRHEERLVRRWYDAVVGMGASGYGWDECWSYYRAASFSGALMGVVASMLTQQTERGDEMFLTMVRRHLDQAADLQAAEFL